MTFMQIVTWGLGVVAFLVLFIIASGSVWESKSEAERELRELRESIRRAEQAQSE